MKTTFLNLIFLLAGALLLAGCNSPLMVEISIPTATTNPQTATAPARPTLPLPRSTATTSKVLPTATKPKPAATATPADPAPTSTQTTLPNLTIQVDPLPNGGLVTAPGPVTVHGTTNRMPFEKTLGYRLLDASGNMLQNGPVPVSGEYGGPGEFSLQVSFQPDQTGDFTIQVFNTSAATGEITSMGEAKVTLQAAQQSTMSIQLDPLPNNGTYQKPATVALSGTVNPVPFEKQMVYQVYDANNKLIDQGPVMVQGEYGSSGTFRVEVKFKATQTGKFTIRVLDTSPKDGSILASAEVSVTIK